jgi:hypothetical protein
MPPGEESMLLDLERKNLTLTRALAEKIDGLNANELCVRYMLDEVCRPPPEPAKISAEAFQALTNAEIQARIDKAFENSKLRSEMIYLVLAGKASVRDLGFVKK